MFTLDGAESYYVKVQEKEKENALKYIFLKMLTITFWVLGHLKVNGSHQIFVEIVIVCGCCG